MLQRPQRLGDMVLVGVVLLWSGWGAPVLHAKKISVGESLVEFRLPLAGTPKASESREFVYHHERARPLVLVFLGVGQERSQRALEDIETTLNAFTAQRSAFDVVGVYSLPNDPDSSPPAKLPTEAFPIVVDRGYVLWGRLGLIVTPTTMVVDSKHLIQWIQPGHGYTFAAGLRSHLGQVLGVEGISAQQQGDPVRVLSHRDSDAIIMRHVRMAARLYQKGQLQIAIQELRKALARNTNHVEASLLLGEILCRTEDSQNAIKAVQALKTDDVLAQARRSMIMGWAHRQLNQLERAEALLVNATTLDPTCSRAFFELGQLYQTQSVTDKALNAYRQALMIIFDQQPPVPLSQK